MNLKKMLKTLFVCMIVINLLILPAFAAASADPPCEHVIVYYGNWYIDDVLSHSICCEVFGCWEYFGDEPCVFSAAGPEIGDLCTLCNQPYWEPWVCTPDTHKYSDWTIYEEPEGVLNHRRYCVECYDIQDEPCSYNGGTICIVCSWDSDICRTCSNTYTIKCGQDYKNICGNIDGTCDKYEYLIAGNNITFGFCGCGCISKSYALQYIEWLDTDPDFNLPDDELWLVLCDEGNTDCICQWECPDCKRSAPPQDNPAPQPPVTTPVSPKMGDDG